MFDKMSLDDNSKTEESHKTFTIAFSSLHNDGSKWP